MHLWIGIVCCLLGLLSSCSPSIQTPAAKVAYAQGETSAILDPGSTTQSSQLAQHSGPAGILVYCRHGGEIHLLVANDRLGIRGWGGFAGGDKKEETTAMTAARETSEETRGYYNQAGLLKMISGQKPIRQSGFSLYFAEVPYVSAKKIMAHPIKRWSPGYFETQHYAWVPFFEIEPLLTKNNLTESDLQLHPRHLQRTSRSKVYWKVWIDQLKQVQMNDGFPWRP